VFKKEIFRNYFSRVSFFPERDNEIRLNFKKRNTLSSAKDKAFLLNKGWERIDEVRIKKGKGSIYSTIEVSLRTAQVLKKPSPFGMLEGKFAASP